MLPAFDQVLALEDRATAAPFTLRGGALVLRGSEIAGLHSVHVADRTHPLHLRIAGAVCTTFRITPLGVERTLRVGDATVMEKIVVSPSVAAFALEWLADRPVAARIEAGVPDFLRIEHAGAGSNALDAGEPLLLVARASEAGAETPSDWITRQRAAASRRAAEWLHAGLPDRRLERALAWAAFRIATGAAAPVRSVAALIAAGDFRHARSLLRHLPADRHSLPLVGRYFIATGDAAFARAQWERAGPLSATPDLDAEALRSLGWLAEALGERRIATDLDRRARSAPAVAPPWHEFDAGHARAGLRTLGALADAGFLDEKGAWPEGDAASAADVVTHFTYGLLGMAGDGAKGRLRLRPQLPEDWPVAAIRNLRVGDALVDFSYRHEAGSRAFRVEQTAGAFPLRLILEPALPVMPEAVTIDGGAAQLDCRPFGERVVAPVQLVLDAPRTVEFG